MVEKELGETMKKRFVLVLIVTAGIIGFVMFQNQNHDSLTEKPFSEKEQVLESLKDDVEEEFLNWIEKNYPKAISKLYKELETRSYEETMWHEVTGYSFLVLQDLFQKKYDKMTNVKILENKDSSAVLSFVGDISLADNWSIMPKYDERGKGVYGILSEDIVKIMTESDWMVANSEFTVSNRGTAIPGKLYTFRAKPERLTIYSEMGVDLVTLANNHVYDFGQDAFLDMLQYLDEYQIPHIGAGKNIEEASMPYYLIINGYKVAFLNATRAEKHILTPAATETSEGVFYCYDPTNMIQKIQEVRKESDIVISIIHFGKEGSHELEKEQVESARAYINAGSDMVIGHHAHTLQGIEFYNHKPIIYNLGNFIFNSEVDETAIFQVVLKNNKELEYKIIPALQINEYTDILEKEGKQKVIQELNSWSTNAVITEEGIIQEFN